MFCNNCGKELPDGSKFCNVCGAQLMQAPQAQAPQAQAPQAQAPQAQAFQGQVPQGQVPQMQGVYQYPVAPQAPSPIGIAFNKFVEVLKNFFKNGPVKTVSESAKSAGLEWIFLALLSVIVYGLALATNVHQILKSILGAASKYIMGEIYNFGAWFLYGLLISIGVYFLMSFVVFGAARLILKKQVKLQCVFNLVATASLPLALAYVLNMILGFIWVPAIFVISLAALIATAVLLYTGIQRLEKLEKSPFIPYVGIWTVVILVVVIILSVVVNNAIESAMSDAISGGLGMLDMFS